MNWQLVNTCVAYGALPVLFMLTFLTVFIMVVHNRAVSRLEKEAKEAFEKGRIQGIADTILANNLLIRSN